LRKIISIVRNDLIRRLKSPVGIIFIMLIPIVITLLIGLVFGGSGDTKLPRIRVLIVDKDEGLVSGFLRQSIQQDRMAEMFDPVVVEEEEGWSLINKGKASALIIIPENFTSRVLDQKPAVIKVVKNPSEDFLPVIVEEVVETFALVLERGVRVMADPISRVRGFFDSGRLPTGDEAVDVLESGRNTVVLVEGYLADSLITLETKVSAEEEKKESFNIFAFLMPGSLMIGILFISEMAMRDILREGQRGTLSRMLSSPLGAGQIVSAKILSAFLITGISMVVLVTLGKFAFNISWGDPLTLTIQTVGICAMSTGIMTFFYGIIRSEKLADAMLSVLIIVLALLGGSMIPYEQMGQGMRQVAHYSPVFWAIDGLKKIIFFSGKLGDIWINLVIMFSIAVPGMMIGAGILRRRIRSGNQ
jgi:ABC-2 type transport system permease protein